VTGASAQRPGDVRELVTASANPDKVDEIQRILGAELPWLVLHPRPPDVQDVVEDADTLLGNARLKARALVRATGMAAVSDDTGLFVDVLDGAPGVRSARYAGEDAGYGENCQKLLAELDRVGATTSTARSARFVTVALVAWPDGEELWCEGVVDGVIADDGRGDGGWGYDPLFQPLEGGGRTFSELGPKAKDAMSHRARAFRSLAAALRTR
jgi:XTP/dITP diphosphohydrolase